MKYRLIPVETEPVTLRMFPQTIKDRVSYGHYIRLEPNKLYETNDPAQIAYLKEHKETVRYSASLENLLKSANVPYDIIRCKSCGGKIKKIEYNNIEVVDNA